MTVNTTAFVAAASLTDPTYIPPAMKTFRVFLIGGVSALGCLTNAISLSYFVNSPEKREFDVLLMMLNIFDLVVCLASTSMQVI